MTEIKRLLTWRQISKYYIMEENQYLTYGSPVYYIFVIYVYLGSWYTSVCSQTKCCQTNWIRNYWLRMTQETDTEGPYKNFIHFVPTHLPLSVSATRHPIYNIWTYNPVTTFTLIIYSLQLTKFVPLFIFYVINRLQS